jgi:hypothetical protein
LVFSFNFKVCYPSQCHGWVSHYCQFCDRNLLDWLMFGVNEVTGGVLVGGRYHRCCCWSYSTCMWLSLSFKLLLDFVLLVVFPLFFRVGVPLFHACWLVAIMLSVLKNQIFLVYL